MTFQELLQEPQYSLSRSEKDKVLLEQLNELCQYHRERCSDYNRLITVFYPGFQQAKSLAELPYIPVSVFKTHELCSVPRDQIFKTLVSSGTTAQAVSQILLDRETARRQTVALSRIMSHVLGPERLPMLIVDTADLLKDRARFSARTAGVLGMMNFGRDHFFALDGDMNLDRQGLHTFLSKFRGGPFLIFGFTFMTWKYFLLRVEEDSLDLSGGILLHGGGWKKMQDIAVDNAEFKRRLWERTLLSSVYNFYGLVEQVGSIYLEGEDGYLYPPNFSDIIVRDPLTWQEAPIGQPGVIQLLSTLPLSYPGHSILTEDLGIVHGVDGSSCGRKGKFFSVIGRVPKAELRGCSDVHAVSVSA
jgi:Acyl-protein synthetase, LuxE